MCISRAVSVVLRKPLHFRAPLCYNIPVKSATELKHEPTRVAFNGGFHHETEKMLSLSLVAAMCLLLLFSVTPSFSARAYAAANLAAQISGGGLAAVADGNVFSVTGSATTTLPALQ